LFGEALAIGGDGKAVGQLQYVLAASSTDHLLVGMNAVREPEIDKLANRWHFSPPIRREHEGLSVTDDGRWRSADGTSMPQRKDRSLVNITHSIEFNQQAAPSKTVSSLRRWQHATDSSIIGN
jgi:hypothetical protein